MIENTLPGQGEKRRLSPEKGNVLFACSSMGWSFTLQSFAKMYVDSFPPTKKGTPGINAHEFARRLWEISSITPENGHLLGKVSSKAPSDRLFTLCSSPSTNCIHTLSVRVRKTWKETLSSLGNHSQTSQYKSGC